MTMLKVQVHKLLLPKAAGGKGPEAGRREAGERIDRQMDRPNRWIDRHIDR